MNLYPKRPRANLVALLGIIVGVFSPALAGDWPMWRYDAERSASTPDALPSQLYLAWWRDLPAPTPSWPEDRRLLFDGAHEPIVTGKTLIVNVATTESVTAFDTETGVEKWRFFAEGPVRFAPVAHQGRLYLGADDGYFYCLDADDGKLLWKFRVAPGPRRVIGNDRLISVWPVRGGPVLSKGKIHFAAGVWPFEGSFLYSVDIQKSATTPHYTTTLLSSQMAQPPYYATTSSYRLDSPSLVPQGYLAQSGSTLLIPGGRAPVTAYDLDQEQFTVFKYRPYGFNPDKTPQQPKGLDCHIAAKGPWLFHGERVFNRREETLYDLPVPRPVAGANGSVLYYGHEQKIKATDLAKPQIIETKDRRGKSAQLKTFSTTWELPGKAIVTRLNQFEDTLSPRFRYEIEGEPVIDLQAGSHLYGRWADVLFAVELPTAEEEAKATWAQSVEGTPWTMLAADGKLFVGTREGRIYCFSGDQKHPQAHKRTTVSSRHLDSPAVARVDASLNHTDARDGYALVWGLGNDSEDRLYQTMLALLRQSDFRIIAVDPDVEKVTRLRERLTAEGLYGERIVVRIGEPSHYDWPPYLANLVLSDNLASAGFRAGVPFVRELFRSLRPYGGAACLELSGDEHEELKQWVEAAELAGAELDRRGELSVLRRVGSLAGTANWEHEYGDSANTLTSRDTLVKAPLGVLWFGGPAADGDLYYDRHRWAPSTAVIGGRMFVQGPEKLTAIDVYTGRILWKTPIPTGLSPGRRGWISVTGFHFVAVEDAIYLAYEGSCVRLDPATGKQLAEFRLPDPGDYWGTIRIVGDFLVVPVFRTVDASLSQGYRPGYGTARSSEPGRLAKSLAVLNRFDGSLLWEKAARRNIFMVSVGEDKVFCFDTELKNFYRSQDRRGLDPKKQAPLLLRAFDLATGDELWEQETQMALTWLAYSQEYDVLVSSNKNGVEARRGKDGEQLWLKTSIGYGFVGHPESVWNKVIVRKDQIIDQRGPGRFYDLLTGRVENLPDPVTGTSVPREFTKTGHHCNYAVANEHLLTFRAATAGFFDLESSGTGRLDGFRTGCRNSLIPACGVLNAPNFGHGCACDLFLFTSLSLVHVPENEKWTYNTFVAMGDRVKRVGINFGAPGDRMAPNGTLWLDYPDVGGPSPKLKVKVSPAEARPYRRHAAQIQGEGLKWVGASGIDGVSSIHLALATAAETTPDKRPHTVRLYFSEPRYQEPGQRVFGVSLQGDPVLEKLDIVKEVGGPDRLLVKEFHHIPVAGELSITLAPVTGKPQLSGVEVWAEEE